MIGTESADGETGGGDRLSAAPSPVSVRLSRQSSNVSVVSDRLGEVLGERLGERSSSTVSDRGGLSSRLGGRSSSSSTISDRGGASSRLGASSRSRPSSRSGLLIEEEEKERRRSHLASPSPSLALSKGSVEQEDEAEAEGGLGSTALPWHIVSADDVGDFCR